MKRYVLLMILLMCGWQGLFAQSVHNVTLTWVAPTDATATGIISVYRGSGDCSTNPAMSVVGSVGATLVTYVDPVTPGTYCYFVTHTENKSESLPSNNSVAVLRPNAPSGLTLVLK